MRLQVAVMIACICLASSADAQERPHWDGVVVGAQAGTVLVHGAAAFVGMLPGVWMVFDDCFLVKKCKRSDQMKAITVAAIGATLVGGMAGGLTTWGVGRALDAPGKLLPTLGLSVAGHAIGAVTAIVWADATDYEDDAVWWVPMLVGAVLGTAGGTIGFNTSF